MEALAHRTTRTELRVADASRLKASRLPVRIGVHTRCFPIHKVAAIAATLEDEGVPAAATLGGADIMIGQLDDPASRISYAQMFRVLANAARLATLPDTALRVGQRMHLSAYGMYGFALMTCEGPRMAIDFAARYYGIIGSTAAITFSDSHGVCTWELEPLFSLTTDSALYRFLVDLQFSTHLTLHRDLLGSSFSPHQLCAAYPCPDNLAPYERVFGCPVHFGQPTNAIHVGNAWLEHRFSHANRLTHSLAAARCAEDLETMQRLSGMAGAVRALVEQTPERFTAMNEVAAALGMHERTLRRHLKSEQTTFHDVVRQARLDLAVTLLADTQLSNEAIAGRIGFSDATSFRHAFKRWTAATPSAYRGIGTDLSGPEVVRSEPVDRPA